MALRSVNTPMLDCVGVSEPHEVSLGEGSRTTHFPFCSRVGPILGDEGSIAGSSTLMVCSESVEVVTISAAELGPAVWVVVGGGIPVAWEPVV